VEMVGCHVTTLKSRRHGSPPESLPALLPGSRSPCEWAQVQVEFR
jgi:hypothetical protein